MRSATEQTYRERILRVLVYVQKRLDGPLGLEELARVARFSPHHFHRIFGAMVGESVKEHVRRLRLERAAYRLEFGDRPVTRIAFEAGYETHESFTRAFRAMFGVSPSAFRKARGERARPPAPSKVHYRPAGALEEFQPVQPGGPPMEVRIQKLEPMTLAFIRQVGPYEEAGAAWEKLLAWAGARGLLGPRMWKVGISHDNPHVTPADKLRHDACVTVDPGFRPEGEVGVQTLPGGEYAVVTHKGPFERMHETYAFLYGEWLPRSGREAADSPGFTVHRNSPRDTPPEALVTDIYLPLRPR